MNKDKGSGLAAELEQVREELAAWRAMPGKGQKIPEPVWRKAVQAAKRHGLNPVSKALGLDYSCLKRRVDERGKSRNRRFGLMPAFVEVRPESQSDDHACVVELEKCNGTRLRICVKAATAIDWSKIKEVFMGA